MSYQIINEILKNKNNPVNTPEKLMNYMSDINYGYVAKNGKKVFDINGDEFYLYYRLQTPQEVIKSRLGVCWDQAELERFMFEKYIKLPYKVYYMEALNEYRQTHTFLAYQFNNKWHWFEHSWYDNRGIHTFSNLPSLLKHAATMHVKYAEKNNGCIMWELDKPKYGITCQTFMDFASSGKKVLKI